jgi:hypothetical protein
MKSEIMVNFYQVTDHNSITSHLHYLYSSCIVQVVKHGSHRSWECHSDVYVRNLVEKPLGCLKGQGGGRENMLESCANKLGWWEVDGAASG